MSAERLNRARGAMMGSAVGDSVGLYTEFMTAEQAHQAYGPSPVLSLADPVTEPFQDSHRSRFETSAWTDDTDHTILIVLSYLRNGALDPDDFAKRLRTWCEQGLRCLDRLPMGLGQTVGRVVFNKEFLSNPTAVAFTYWDDNGRNIASNGSVMRTTPIGIICMDKSEEETFQAAIRMGAVTHADPRCALSVAIVSALVRGLCRGEIMKEEDVDAVLERAWAYMMVSTLAHHLEREEYGRHVRAESLDALVLCSREMGYVYKCLGSALWCLRQVICGRETFKSAMMTLVMCGGDADTNAAVAGALMGAYCGYNELPPEWKDGLRHKEWYMEKILSLCIVAGLVDGIYDAQGDTDTEPDGGKGFLTEDEMKKREMAVMEKILLAGQRRRSATEPKAKENKSWKFWPSFT